MTGRAPTEPGLQGYAPQPAAPSSPVGADPSRVEEELDSILRSKARALAASVWTEHRGHALRFESLSFESSELLIDCCLKGMCVGIIGGSSLARDSDESPKGGDADAAPFTTARAEGIASEASA